MRRLRFTAELRKERDEDPLNPAIDPLCPERCWLCGDWFIGWSCPKCDPPYYRQMEREKK